MGLECMETLWGLVSRKGDMAILVTSSMVGQKESERKDDKPWPMWMTRAEVDNHLLPTVLSHPPPHGWLRSLKSQGLTQKGQKAGARGARLWKSSDHDRDRPTAF